VRRRVAHLSCGLLAAAALLAALAHAAQGLPLDPLATDEPATLPPPQMLEMTIPSHGAQLYGVFYQAGAAGAHATLLLLHGFAGFEQNEDLAQAARRAGFNVLIFHYRGSWGSTGTFSFAHCIEDTEAVLGHLRSHAQELAVDPRHIVLAGHSVGGQVAGVVAARDPQISGLALISAANRRLAMARPGWAVDTRARFQGELGPLRGTTAGMLVSELESHARQWDLVTLAPQWRDRAVLVVSSDDRFRDEDDAVAAAAAPAHLTAVHLNTDHAYSGQRVALTRALLAWLEGTTRPTP
jgi:pimeloyl-ACP methyl ester carboxylesterase